MSKENQQGFRHFDLPVDHLEVGSNPEEDRDFGNWVPPQSHDDDEIDMFRTKPGLCIATRQHSGTLVEAYAMELSLNHALPDSFYKLLGAAAFNTAFYEHGNGTIEVMRRRLWLPVPGDLEADSATRVLTNQAKYQLEHASEETGKKVALTRHTRSGNNPNTRKQIGRRLGNASLAIGAIPKAEKIANAWDEEHQQEIVRSSAIDIRKASISLARHLGVYPSIGQLGARRTPLVDHVANNKSRYSSAAIRIIDQAQDEVFEYERELREAS